MLYSAGTDNIIKAANAITGKVVSKLAVPQSKSEEEDYATHLLSLTSQHIILGTDLGNLHIYDTRSPSKPTTHRNVHTSYISSISALPPTSESTSNMPKSFVTTGDSTIAVFDVHKGLITKSEPQDDEILSSCVVAGVGKGRRYTRAYVGMGEGTIHAFERGIWKDMVERIKVAKKDIEVDVMIDASKCGFLGQGESGVIAAGCGDGIIKIVKLGDNRVIHELEHKGSGNDEDEEEVEEGITALAVDCDGALISGGGECVRIWYEKDGTEQTDPKAKISKEEQDSDDSDDDDEKSSGGWSSDSDDSDVPKKKTKEKGNKRKRKKGKENMRGLPKKKVGTSFAGLD